MVSALKIADLLKITSFSPEGMIANRVWNRVEDILQRPNKKAGLCTVDVEARAGGHTVQTEISNRTAHCGTCQGRSQLRPQHCSAAASTPKGTSYSSKVIKISHQDHSNVSSSRYHFVISVETTDRVASLRIVLRYKLGRRFE